MQAIKNLCQKKHEAFDRVRAIDARLTAKQAADTAIANLGTSYQDAMNKAITRCIQNPGLESFDALSKAHEAQLAYRRAHQTYCEVSGAGRDYVLDDDDVIQALRDALVFVHESGSDHINKFRDGERERLSKAGLDPAHESPAVKPLADYLVQIRNGIEACDLWLGGTDISQHPWVNFRPLLHI